MSALYEPAKRIRSHHVAPAPSGWLSLDEAAELMDCSASTVYRRARAGQLESLAQSNRLWISERSVRLATPASRVDGGVVQTRPALADAAVTRESAPAVPVVESVRRPANAESGPGAERDDSANAEPAPPRRKPWRPDVSA